MRDPTLLANRFRIDSLIAEGGMAKVYRGTDLLLGRTVAVKVLAAHLARDPAFVVRFQREARSAASLSHANVVSVFDTGSDGDHHFIVMEFVEGRTLAEVIRTEAPLDPMRASAIAASACEALSVAHARGMVHRDVKPGNILIDSQGVVKVMDFGIAKTAADGLTQAGAVLGTVSYISPEQAAGEKVDLRSDIFALGCVLYEMLTGAPPVTGESLVEVAHKLSHFTPPRASARIPAVPEVLDAILERALARDPEDRFADAEEMRRALQGAPFEHLASASATARTMVAGAPLRDERTRVMAGKPPRSPQRTILLFTGLLLVGGGLYASFAGTGGGKTEQPSVPGALLPSSGTTTQVTTSLPATTTTSTEPPTTITVTRRPAVVAAALEVQDAANAGLATGVVTERAARAVLNEVERALKQFDQGDIDDALGDVQDARDEVARYLSKGDIPPEHANALNRALDDYGRAIVR